MRKIDLLKSIRTFMLVAEKQSFTQAARELNIVASAVSRQVVELETHFNCQLLYRTTRAMHLTGEGKFYLEQFKDISTRVEQLEDIASSKQQALKASITVSAPRGSAALGYLQASSEFVRQHPQVRISWLFLNRFVNMVEEGIDLSIRVGKLSDSNLVAREYTQVKIYFVASPQYLQQFGEPTHPKQLIKHRCILDTSIRTPGRWHYRDKGNEQSITLEPFAQANDGEATAQLATYGQGIALLPDILMQEQLDNGQLVPILQDFSPAPSPVSLVFPGNKLLNPSLRALIDFLLAHKPG